MNDLTNLILQYYGCATWNSGKTTVEKMIDNYNTNQKIKVGHDASWCAILLYNLCKFLKYETGEANCWVGTWCNVGENVLFDAAKMGDIVIIGNNVNQTHISTFVRFSNDKTYMYLLGGNQGNEINIAKFPVNAVFKIIRLNKIKTQ